MSDGDEWVRSRLSALVLGVHRRNGGSQSVLRFDQRLLDPALILDSLDLAEIMAAVEREFGVSPFEGTAPRTWGEVAEVVEAQAPRRPFWNGGREQETGAGAEG